MNKVIIIAGPTAVGKSKLAVELAKKLNTEIISADSMQIYRNLDIGTAKITQSEMQGIKHHLINIIEPTDEFSVMQFQKMALEIIESLHNKGKIPIICGGTGLYIDSLTHNFDFMNIKPDQNLRENLETIYKNNPQDLLDMVLNIDKDYYSHIKIREMKKMIRIIEVFKYSGKKINYFRSSNSKNNYYLFVLNDNRESLYSRINSRVDHMLNLGLIDEVRLLIENGVNSNCQSMKAIGYKEVISYINNEISKSEMIDLLKKNSRNYAKRQLTWFRRNEFSNWIDVSNFNNNDIIEYVLEKSEINLGDTNAGN